MRASGSRRGTSSRTIRRCAGSGSAPGARTGRWRTCSRRCCTCVGSRGWAAAGDLGGWLQDLGGRLEGGEPDPGGAAEAVPQGAGGGRCRGRRLRLPGPRPRRGRRGGQAGCCDGGMLPGLGLCGPAVLPRGWGGASRNERIAAALADLEAARQAEDAARREQAEAYLAKARAGKAPPGRIPEEAAVAVAQIALEQAAAAQQAKRDAYDQRVAASAGRGVRGTRPAPPEQAAPVRRCRERLAAARRPQRPGPPRPRKRKPGRARRAGTAGRARGSGTRTAQAGAQHHRPGFARDALHPQRHRAGL